MYTVSITKGKKKHNLICRSLSEVRQFVGMYLFLNPVVIDNRTGKPVILNTDCIDSEY